MIRAGIRFALCRLVLHRAAFNPTFQLCLLTTVAVIGSSSIPQLVTPAHASPQSGAESSEGVVAAAETVGETAAASVSQPLTFEADVRPILKKHCFHCHGEETEIKGGLDLRLVRLMTAGGDSGAALVAFDPDGSVLLQRLDAGEMPPDKSKLLSAEEVQTIRQWIAGGAKTLNREPDSLDPGLYISEAERQYWAFQPIRRPDVPEVRHRELVANPIDAFLLARLEAAGFAFSRPAESSTLTRRLHLDLHGIPSVDNTQATVIAGQNELQGDPGKGNSQRDLTDADAFRMLVDELLESPRYAERWAGHWLDVAGYADSEGYNEIDAERPHAWRYRDYVIRSFAADKPFDQFIREQLAGDELTTSPRNNLSEADAELLAATGFLRMAPDGTGGAVPDVMLARNDTVADTMRIVSTSLLGLTVGCAQCHDHRYDPISQEDYYRFRAIFDPAFDWQNWRNPQQRLVSLYTDSDRTRAAEIEIEAKQIEAERVARQHDFIEATFESELAKLPAEIRDAARSARETEDAKRTKDQKTLLKKYPSLNVTAGSLYLYDKKAADELKALADKAAAVRKTKPVEGFVRAMTEVAGRIPESRLFYRGDHEQPKQVVLPGDLKVVSLNTDLPGIVPAVDSIPTSGRRLQFADQLTSPKHPLPARVIVNRVWMHHFGVGIVATPGDFGMLGQRPTHPELLDWLASEFISSGWSLKHLHRLILNSNAWKQSIRNDPAQDIVDPDNLLYGGARLVRLDAEALRDSLLAISGLLNEKRFGEPVPVMADVTGRFVIGKENLNAGRPGPVIDMQGEQYRRSIYIQARRSRPLVMLETFDRPAMSPNCELRKPSTSSTQSLMLLNSDQAVDFSRKTADRVIKETGEQPVAQVRRAWQLAYNRWPDESELAGATHFLEQQSAIFREQLSLVGNPPAGSKNDVADQNPEREALAVLCHMIVSSNEFLYVD